jgi:hypothetical protein
MVDGSAHYPETVYYLGQGVQSRTATQLEKLFCTPTAQFEYIERDLGNGLPDTKCLVERGAVRVPIVQRRFPMAVWIVRRQMSPP